ncbi:MAG: hypothetical protein ACP5LE_06975 [Thermoplasmata archaeon]
MLTLLLSVLGFAAWKRTKQLKFCAVGLAYLLFFVQTAYILCTGLADFHFPVGLEYIAINFGIVLLFYLAILK